MSPAFIGPFEEIALKVLLVLTVVGEVFLLVVRRWRQAAALLPAVVSLPFFYWGIANSGGIFSVAVIRGQAYYPPNWGFLLLWAIFMGGSFVLVGVACLCVARLILRWPSNSEAKRQGVVANDRQDGQGDD